MKWLAFTSTLLIFYLPASAATIEEVKQYGKSYLEDLPNIVCTYTEYQYAWRGWGSFSSALNNELHDPDWKRKRWHTGELRWNRSDIRWNRKILTFKGKRTKKKLHKISHSLGNYGSGVDYSGWEWERKKWGDKEYADDGSELDIFEIWSDRGVTLHRGLDKHRNLKKPRPVPAKGKILAEKETGRIIKVVLEHPTDKEDYSRFNRRSRGDSWMIYEYGYVEIDGREYLLPKRFIFEYKNGSDGNMVVIDHYNYRRFKSKTTILTATSRINFGGKELGSETKFPPQTQKEPKPVAEETEAKEAVVPAPIKPKPPVLTRVERVRKSRRFKQLEPGAVEFTRRGTNYFGDYIPTSTLAASTPPKPKPAPKNKVVETSTFSFGFILDLLFVVLSIAGMTIYGMHYVRD